MGALLSVSRAIDGVIGVLGKIGAWASLLLVLLVCYDVVSRYFGVPKPFGLNSTMIQEGEYWLHTYLFALFIGYGYTRQAHVRIDLFRERLPRRGKYLIEMIGCLLFLIPYAAIGTYLATGYVATSFAQGEVSKSVVGLSNIWLLKAALYPLYVLMGLAGISQFIKSLAGFFGQLPEEQVGAVIGG